VPRRAFFSRSEGRAARVLGTVSFHLGDASPGRQRDRESAAPGGLRGGRAREASNLECCCARVVHVAHICTAAEANAGTGTLAIGWQGVGRRCIWAVTRAQAGKQEHELLLLHAGSEGSCSWVTCLSILLLTTVCICFVPMRRWVLQGCSRAALPGTGWDSRRAASEQHDCGGTVLTRPGRVPWP